MEMQEIFEMQATRKDDLRKSAVYTRHALTCMARHFGVKTKNTQTTWTDSEGKETWALNVGDFVLYPGTVQRKSIRGTEFIEGWVIERVHVSVNHHSDSPFYEDVDSESIFETPNWIHALEKIVVESFVNKVTHDMESHGLAHEYGGSKND